MGYSDQKYNTRVQKIEAPNASFGTATASGAAGHTLTDVAELPKFYRRTQVNLIRLKTRTIPNAASTGLIARFMNGTNTLGTAVLTTAALGSTIDAVLTTNNILTAETEPTVNLVGTSTASAAACGAYDVFFETQELYA